MLGSGCTGQRQVRAGAWWRRPLGAAATRRSAQRRVRRRARALAGCVQQRRRDATSWSSGVLRPANVTAAGLLLAAGRASRHSWSDLGTAPHTLRAGAGWGDACFALVAGGYAAVLAVPAARPLLEDARFAGLDGELAYTAVIRIPLGTVLWGEVAFRGVLLAALARIMPIRRAVGISATVFGLWHVRPTITAIEVNDLVDGPLVTGLVVLLGCLMAGAGGLVMAWLRLRSGSLLASALLHVATNSLGTLAAATASRLA